MLPATGSGTYYYKMMGKMNVNINIILILIVRVHSCRKSNPFTGELSLSCPNKIMIF